MRRVEETGLCVAQVDSTVFAELPKLTPYKQRIAQTLAAALGLDPSRVNVKAKTAEGLGPVGRGEAMRALAIATLVPAPTPE